jgi:hypothetical protein
MINTKTLIKTVGLVLVAGVVTQAQAVVDYTIGGNIGTDLETFSFTLDNNAESGLAGAIDLTPSGANPGPAPLATVCVDLSGVLYLGDTYSFTGPLTFNGAGSGLDPTWGGKNATGNTFNSANASAAIENAAYLFSTYSGLLTTGSVSQKAALQLAVWSALYNTEGNSLGGAAGLTVNSGRLSVTGGDATAISLADTMLASIPTTFASYAGYLLQPDPTVQYGLTGQELFDNVSAVPEPATVIAGMLLLLPLCASAFRIVRNRKTRVL